MECIICYDTGPEPLQDNIWCTCKYKIHNSCWIDYVHSKTKVTCLICHQERVGVVESNTNNQIISELPTTIIQGHSIVQQPVIQQISVQVSVQTINDSIPKIVKIGICLVILILVLVLIWV